MMTQKFTLIKMDKAAIQKHAAKKHMARLAKKGFIVFVKEKKNGKFKYKILENGKKVSHSKQFEAEFKTRNQATKTAATFIDFILELRKR